MSKIFGDFWLSPEGEVLYCISHNSMADDIVRRRGWIKHCDRPWYHGWCIPPNTKLTQAQIDKIYELCGEVPEDSNLLGPYCVRSFFGI